MENQENKNVETQGVETTKRNASPATTMKSFGTNVKKLIELKLVNEKDGKLLKEIHAKAVKQYMGFELDI